MLGVSMVLGASGCGPVADDDGVAQESGDTPASTTMAASSGGSSTSTGAATETGTSSSGVSTDESGVDDSDDSPGSFYAGAPDTNPIDECSTYQQDCPLDEKCMPWASDGGNSWLGTRCSPVSENPDELGEPCLVEGSAVSGIDSCGPGLLCTGVDERTNEGTCVAMCGGTSNNPMCDGANDVCVQLPYVGLCAPTCDPMMQDCPQDQGCFPQGDEFVCFPSAAPESAPGDPCDVANGCAPGQLCVAAEGLSNCAATGCCSEICANDDPGASAACTAMDPAHVCTPWFSMPPVGLENVGVCSLPEN